MRKFEHISKIFTDNNIIWIIFAQVFWEIFGQLRKESPLNILHLDRPMTARETRAQMKGLLFLSADKTSTKNSISLKIIRVYNFLVDNNIISKDLFVF